MNSLHRIRTKLRSWLPAVSISIALPRLPDWLTPIERPRQISSRPALIVTVRAPARRLSLGWLVNWLPMLAVLLGLALCLTSLWGGFRADDDLLHRHTLLNSSLSVAAADMFVFLDPAITPARMDRGELPWWTLNEARISFFRPLAVFSHWVDYQLWPDWPGMMHAHNLLWYGVLCALAGLLYRRFHGRGWAAGLAALLFAVNVPHISGVMAINARNSIMTAVFGILALVLHDRWRRGGNQLAAWLAPLYLLLSLFSAEAGIASAAYLFAYAVCIDEGSWPGFLSWFNRFEWLRRMRWAGRLASLIPAGVVIVSWRLVYQVLGYGAYGSDFYLDPGREPLRFALTILERWPVILFGQWVMPDPGINALLSSGVRLVYGLVAWGFTVLLIVALWRLLRTDRLARFWGLGMALAILPVCAINPATGRHLIFVGIGAIGLLSHYAAEVFNRSEPLNTRWTTIFARGSVVLLMAFQGVFYPLAAAGIPDLFDSPLYLAMMNLGPLPGVQDQDVVLVNAPSPGQSIYIYSIRAYQGQTLPAHLRLLSPGSAPVKITRTGPNSLALRPFEGYLRAPDAIISLPTMLMGNAVSSGERLAFWPLADASFATLCGDALFRSRLAPFQVGDRVQLTGMTAEVAALTADERPLEVIFHFDHPLEDATLRWLAWDWQSETYQPFKPPALGETVVLPGPLE